MAPEKSLQPLLQKVTPPFLLESKVYDTLAETPLLDEDIALKPCASSSGSHTVEILTDGLQQIGRLPSRRKMATSSHKPSPIVATGQNTQRIPWTRLSERSRQERMP